MAVKTIQEKVDETLAPHTGASRDLYRQETAAGRADDLEAQYAAPAISNKERRRNQPHAQHNPVRRWQLLASKRARRGASLMTVILILFGGGGAVTMFMSPALAVVQLKQIVTKDLNDQIKAFDARSQLLLRSKLKNDTKGSCGVVVIKCKFATMNDKRIEKFTNNNFEIEKGKSHLFGRLTRHEIKSITHVNSRTGVRTVMNAEEFTRLSMTDPVIRADLLRGYNPWWYTVSDKVAKTTLAKFGASKRSKITGPTDEQRQQALNSAVSQGARIDPQSLKPETDEDGKPTGRYIGPDGQVMTESQIRSQNESAAMAEQAAKVKPSKIISSIGKGVLITAVADSACTVFNAMRMVGEKAKTERARQAVQFATAGPLSVADEIIAGVSDDDKVTFIGNKINNVGGPAQPDKIIDESRITDAGSLHNPPMIDNPKQYYTAFDGAGPMVALHGTVKTLDTEAAQLSLAGGFIGTLSKINEYITVAVTGGVTNDPQVISQKCKYIQNPYVRGAALAAGIFVGLGSFGMSTAINIGGSLALAMALPFALSMTADIVAGEAFKNLSGESFGNGTFVGAAAALGGMAKNRGGTPLSSQEAVAYTNSTKLVYQQYADAQRQLARSEPFNIYNEYSFLGSIATTVAPAIRSSGTGLTATMASLVKLIPTSLASLTGTSVKADNDIERFSHCPDPTYKRLNIGADIFCNIRYGWNNLDIDPLENAQWMADTGNIDPPSDTGAAKSNGNKWNFSKYLKECVEPMSIGEPLDDEDPESDGTRCLSEENKEMNDRFGLYLLDTTVNMALDDDTELDDAIQAPTGGNGLVGSNGWAYPTVQSAYVSEGGKFNDPTRPTGHKGVDLVDAGIHGKPIYAAHDGVVTAAGPANGFGNWIIISFGEGSNEVSLVYGHMEDDGLFVKVGDRVTAGQPIGKVGNKGESTGAHLHFEIWEGGGRLHGGRPIDPWPIISAAKSQPSGANRDV